MILGTAAYMSPEQAKGRPADKRSDVWAFGCVLYEMLTGRRAFPGDDVMETLSAVIRAEPDFAAIPRDVPPNVRTLIEQCLIKDRRERIADVAVARYVLDSPNTIPSTTSQREHAAGSRWMWALLRPWGSSRLPPSPCRALRRRQFRRRSSSARRSPRRPRVLRVL